MVVLNQYIFYFDFFCIIGISKHTNVIFVGDTCLITIKLDINYNCIMDAFLKLNHFAFFVCTFNFPCDSHFIPYIKR